MSDFESTQTLPPDDNLINDDPNNPALNNAGVNGDGQDGAIDDDRTPSAPLETRPVTYQELLDQNPDMNPHLKIHVERLAAEDESQRAEITPEHHQKHITIAEPIVPDIKDRPKAEQDLIGEAIEVGETAVDSEEPTAPELLPSSQDEQTETFGQVQELSEMSPEAKKDAASQWVKEHLVTEEEPEDLLRLPGDKPNVRLELAEDETVPTQYGSEIAQQLLKSDDYHVVDSFEKNIDKFSNLDHSVAETIIEGYNTPTVIFEHPEKFPDLKFDDALADKLMANSCGELVVEHAAEFEGIALDARLSERLVASGNAYAVLENIDQFSGVTLDSHFLDHALENPRNAVDVSRSIEMFEGVKADDAMARRIVKADGLNALSDSIGNFHDLSNDLFKDLVSESSIRRIEAFKNIASFPSLDKTELVSVMSDIAKSPDNDLFGTAYLPKEVQSALLTTMIEDPDFEAKTIRSFSTLDNEAANKLIAHGYIAEVLDSIDSFPDFTLDLPIAEKLLDGQGSYPGVLLANISKFPPEIHQKIAEGVIASGWAEKLEGFVESGGITVSESLSEKLKSLNDVMGGRVSADGVKAYQEAFPDIDPNVLAKRLLEQRQGTTYADYEVDNINESLKNLTGLDKSIAESLLASGLDAVVGENLTSFRGLDKGIAESFINAGRSRLVILNAEAFDGFSITTGQAIELLKNETSYDNGLTAILELMDPSQPPQFNNDVALKLIEKNDSYTIANYIEHFKNLDGSVVTALALWGKGDLILDHVESFKDLSQVDIAKILITNGMSTVIFRRLGSIEGLDHMDADGSTEVERFKELLNDKELVALIGNDGPLNTLSNGFLELYMHCQDPKALSAQLKALVDGDTALWRINHEYAKLLVGEVGNVGYLENYKVDSIPMALPRKDIGEVIADLPSPVKFADMDADSRRLILNQAYLEAHPDLMSEGEITFTDLNPETQDTLLAYRLYESIAETRDTSAQAHASERNRLFAEAGEYWQSGDLAHATGSVASLRQIMLSGILCGETIGSSSSSDSYPFNVDTVLVSGEVLAAEGHEARLHALKNSHYGSLVLLMHRTEESIDFNKELQGGMNEDHRLVFGAIPGTEISAIMLRDAEADESNDVIDSVIEAGVYIPVIDQQGNNILTYEDYQQKRADGNYITIQPHILDSSFKREGTQGGSNEGAIFIIPSNGATESYYVKFGDASALKHDHLWNEILADRLYRAVTPDLVPDTEPVIVEGRLAKASRIVEVAEGAEVTDEARNAGFIMDTFLGNWDAVYNAANLVMTTDGRAMRIDTGNSLDFRAQGEHKAEGEFSDTVREIETGSDRFDLRSGMRQKYPGLTDEMITTQVRELRDRLPDEMIDALTESIRRPRAEREDIARTLKARKQYLIDKFL